MAPLLLRIGYFGVYDFQDVTLKYLNLKLLVNLIPTRLCHVMYCHGDKSYPCLVGIGLTK